MGVGAAPRSTLEERQLDGRQLRTGALAYAICALGGIAGAADEREGDRKSECSNTARHDRIMLWLMQRAMRIAIALGVLAGVWLHAPRAADA